MDFYKKIFRCKKLRFRILRALRFIPDKPMLKLQYRIKSGRKLNSENPERYTEKIQWYKLNYRDPVMQQCADKYTVRDYVESKGLGGILNKIHAVFETPDDICFDSLPESFVLKMSNGSGTNLLVENKNTLDLQKVKKSFEDYACQCRACAGREWVYQSDHKPVIVAEKYLKDPTNKGGSLRDYKILCFNGKPHYIICVDGRYTDDYCHVVYNTNWEKQDVIIGDSSAAANYDRPDKLSEMLSIAETLSRDFPAARIDLYCIEGKIYFGEITFFPWSGYMDFTPDSFDFELGKCFELPQKNN
ncbi:MAG: carbonic anhydrase [Clostridia bacterium]|nr:carbonic anhydrase [Clostridia bacterium]